METFDSNPFEI